MSQENVEIVQAAFEAWNAGEMDALLDLCDPYVIVCGLEGWLEGPEPNVGREAVMRGFGRMRETWDADAAETVTDFIDAGDRVVARFIWRGTGHGPAFGLEVTAIYTLRKGKIFLVEYFRDLAEALEAVGLSQQTMSQENVELFRRGFEAWYRRDVEALLENCDPAIELHMALQTLVGGEAAVYHGHEGVRAYFRDIDETFAWLRAEYSEVRDLGDRILAIGSFRARGRASGAEVESPVGTVVETRDGKATRIETFLDPKEALEAAGLSN